MKFVKTQIVQITGPNDKVELTCMEGYGIFTVFVEDADKPNTGASGAFTVAANIGNSSISRICSATGLDGEAVVLTWANNERPKLGFSGRPNPEFLPKRYLVLSGALSVGDIAK